MVKPLKLGALLALTDLGGKAFRHATDNISHFFAKSQGAFLGEFKTYAAKEGTVDDPSKRADKQVVTTVDEKLDWFVETNSGYIKSVFSQERTNASGKARAHLVVDGEDWGEFTSNELLRLKSILEDGGLSNLYNNIPVRSDSERWSKTTNDRYESDRAIFETAIVESVVKTTKIENYILIDPNIDKLKTGQSYTPMIGQRNSVEELGNATAQKFSGEYSQLQKANILKRRAALILAVTSALKEANDIIVEESAITATKIFDYLHGRS